MSTVRDLVFHDSEGRTTTFAMGDRDHLTFSTAFDTFVRAHLSEANTTFRIERVLTDEFLVIETAVGVIGRSRGGEEPETTYRRYERHSDMTEYALRFAHSGYSALDRSEPWESDRASVLSEAPVVNTALGHLQEQEAHEARQREVREMPQLDRALLTTFYKAWADHGYVEYASDEEQYYVLFDSMTTEDAGAARAELITVIQALGLEIVDTPESASAGEVWVRADPRVDAELEQWA
ncbi:hypothetical protein [Pseudactinotalea suaedae]|uniref:hypothetical protein n=1 Tax=Pseudactinotalea suaedae TaxID=1524924 RepID=UPI0012E26899|nr:hypothetical protein [Pseudactinotalea suaedae]